MRNIWKRIKKDILRLSEKNANVYTFSYVFCFILMLAAGAGLPDVLKSVLYPVFFEKKETQGIITRIIKDEIPVASGKPRKAVLPVCYFEVDGFQILVTSTIEKKYQEGEWYPYYIYEAGRVQIAERKNYTLLYGAAGCVLEVLIFFVGAGFCLTETNNRQYLKQCSKNADNTDIWLKKQKEQKKGIGHWESIIYVIVMLLIIFWLSRTIYYFILLF